MNFKSLLLLTSILTPLSLGIILKRWQLLLSVIPLLIILSDRKAYPHIQVERIPLPQRVIVGTQIDVKIRLRAEAHPPFMVEVSDALPQDATLIRGTNKGVFSLREGEEGVLHYQVSLPRGHHTFGPATLVASNLSATHTQKSIDKKTVSTIALTRFEEIRMPLIPKRHRSTAGIFSSRFVGRGKEFFSVRNYYWGDEQRIINWKATARTGKLKSNDYESERAVDALIVVDAREEPFHEKSVLDYSLTAALSCVYFLLREKNRVGLLIFSDIQYFISFEYGKKQFLKMADALSGVTPKGRHPFRYVVGFLKRLPRSCLVIIVSPLLDSEIEEDMLQLSSSPHQLFIVSPSPIELESRTLSQTREMMVAKRLLAVERKILLRRLSPLAKIVDWDTSTSLISVMEDLR